MPPAGHGRTAAAAIVALCAGCSRPAPPATTDGGPPEAGTAEAGTADAGPLHAAEHPPRMSRLSQRRHFLILGAMNVLLRPYLQVLEEHFGGEGDEPLNVQRVDLAGGRTAFLVSRLDDRDPILLEVEGAHLLWADPMAPSKSHPGFAHEVLAPRADAGIAMFGYVAGTHSLEARMTGEDGKVISQARIAAVDACNAVSAVYRAGLGWLVACTAPSETHAQLLGEDGKTRWGPRGAALGDNSGVGPATLVFDTPETWVLLQRAIRADADHLVAFRYDLRPEPIWSAPSDLGVPRRTSRGDRFEVEITPEGSLRLELPQGFRGAPTAPVEVAADGGVRVVSP